MADTRWTKEQLDAITEKDCNLLVAAAAGSGKTAVLVERIIRKITDSENPIDIDKLLIVTFTNAAATEMRERIAEAISRALESNPGSKVLQRQLTLLNKASITTMHSFCLEVIRNNFQHIELDPNFRIANDTETLLLKMEALDELFEDIYDNEQENEGFFELLECYGGNRDDQAIHEMVLTLYEFVQSHPWPEQWLHANSEMFNMDEGQDLAETPWGKVLLENMALELAGLADMMRRALGIIKYAEGLEPYLPTYQEELSDIEALMVLCHSKEAARWDRMYDAVSSFEFARLPRCGKDADKEKQEVVKEIRNDVKSRIKKLKEDLFQAPSSEIIKELGGLYPLMKYLSSLVSDFSARYTAKKRQKFLVDFNDLEHLCLNLLVKHGDGSFTSMNDESLKHGGSSFASMNDESLKHGDSSFASETGADSDGNSQLTYVPSEVACEYKEKFEEILVDEYQDSNLVQEIIVNMISKCDKGQPNIFMVGDVKQSIYRFRQAKPELFLEKYNTYSHEKGEKFRKIQLFKNFRSRREVVDSVNFVFKQIMSIDVGEIDYNDTEALNLGAAFAECEDSGSVVGGAAELHIIDVGKGNSQEDGSFDSDIQEEGSFSQGDGSFDLGDGISPYEEDQGEAAVGEEEETLDSIQCEARIVAKRILQLMEGDSKDRVFKVFDKVSKEYRKVDFKDIVILLRTTKNWTEVFLEELAQYGIPAFADTGTGFFKTVEVQIVLSLLQIIDNPLQDIPLLAVLRSPIASFSPEDLVDVRLADRKASIYDALKKLAGTGQEETSLKAAEFLEMLEAWRDKALYMSTDELIWHLYTDTGFYSYAGAMPGGQQRQANLRMLFERARQFEETSYKGLFNFINFINKLKSNKGDMGSAKILGENENVVRIMSIHKSKGLEFPVVILAGCGKQFNLQDMNKKMLLHQELGFGPDFVDHRRRISYPSIPKQAARCKVKIESISEEMRVLYVAFTRAKEKLILTGTVKNLEKSLSKWSRCIGIQEDKLPGYEMLRGRNYLDWICPSMMRHKNCSQLRSIAGIEQGFFIEDSSTWEVRAWNKSDVLSGRIEEGNAELENANILEKLDTNATYSEYADEISRRLDWSYELQKATEIPTKVSVTELKRRFAKEASEEIVPFSVYMPPLVKKPSFMEEIKGLSAAEAGSVLHFVMQHLEFGRTGALEEITFQIGELVFNDLLTEQQSKSVDVRKIDTFLKSSLGVRLMKSGKVYREVPFNIEVCSNEFYKELGESYKTETILLQGVIDCYFEEPDGIVLLDYKTDYVAQGKSEDLRERYRIQIEYYAKALELLTGLKVKEKYIYLFWNGEVLEY